MATKQIKDTLRGAKVKVKNDYMNEAVEGYITRIRVEVRTATGKETLVSVRNLSDICFVKEEEKDKNAKS